MNPEVEPVPEAFWPRLARVPECLLLEINYWEEHIERVNDRMELRIFSRQLPISVRALELRVDVELLLRRSH